ncbi:MAG: type restriction enzyme subunit [Eubacteriales bacterium]|nr:type restriction enzyme subunit [Eubacteriales bacterium]
MAEEIKQAHGTPTDLPEGFKMTELGPLPEEWEVVRLGEVGEVTAGGSAPQGQHYFNGRHPFVRVQHLDEDGYWVRRWDLITDEAVQAYRLRLFRKGTIVFPKSGASIRLEKRAVLPVDAYLVSHLCAVIPKDQIIDQTYLFYVLKSRKLSSEKAEGYPTLALSEIKSALIPLPPLPEQRAIAHVLRTVQRAKEATERVIQATRELKKSLMRHLFTYGPVPVNEVDKVPLKETEIGLVPEHWEVVRIGEVVQESFSGGTPPTNVGEYWGGNIPWTTSAIIGEDEVLLSRHQRTITNLGLANSSSKIAPRESVIVGTRVGVGKAVVATFDIAINQDLTALVLNKESVEPLFLVYLFKSACLQQQIQDRTRGTTIKGIPRRDLLGILIPLPPLSEQREIARILGAVDKKLQAEEARKQALEALFKTLLHNLMTGKIRVNNISLPETTEVK